VFRDGDSNTDRGIKPAPFLQVFQSASFSAAMIVGQLRNGDLKPNPYE